MAKPQEYALGSSVAAERRLLTAIRAVQADLSLPGFYQAVVDGAATLSSAQTIALFAMVGESLRCVAVGGSQQRAEAVRDYPPLSRQWHWLCELEDALHPVTIEDTSSDPHWHEFVRARPAAQQIRSWVALPLVSKGRFLGFLDLGFEQRTPAATNEQPLVREYAADVAGNLRHALLLAENSADMRYERIGRTIQAVLYGNPEQEALDLPAVLATLAEACNVSCAALHLAPTATTLQRNAWYTRDGAGADRGIELALLSALTRATHLQRPIVVAQLATSGEMDEVLRAHKESLLACDVRTLLITPLLYQGESLGALALLQLGQEHAWQPGEILLAQEVADDVALALKRAYGWRRRAQDVVALQRERELLRAAIDQLPLGVLVADAPEQIMWLNRAAASMAANQTRGPDGELIAQPQFTLAQGDGEPVASDAPLLQRAYDEGRSVTEAVSVRRRDGRLVPTTMAATPLRDQQGRIGGVLAVIEDSTSRTAIEQEAHRNAGHLSLIRTMVSSLSTGMQLQDLLTRIAESLQELVPYDWLTVNLVDDALSRVERVGRLSGPHEDGSVAAVPPDEHDLVQRVLQTRRPVLVRDVTDDRVLDEDEALTQAGVRACLAAPIMQGDSLLGSLAVMSRQPDVFGEQHLAIASSIAQLFALVLQRDIAVQDARESAVREERERLAREIHDTLAQTITGMVMQLDLVVTTTPSDAPQRSKLEQTRAMAREALAETRRTVWNMRPQHVNLQVPRTVLQEEVATFERRMRLKPEVISSGEERQVAPEVGAVLQRLLHVVLENIWTHSAAQHVRILMDYGLQSLTILIEDDGRGFDPEAVDLQGEGRVGLAGIAERVRSIGGTLRVESAANQGTRVQVELPYAPAPPAPAPPPVADDLVPIVKEAATPDAMIRVVLIDDHAMVREGLERMMQDQADVQVVAAAANGAEGLRRIAELEPDVVLCDLQLPDMSGIEVISKVRTHYPDIRCLVVTTYADDESIYEGFKAGAKGYVLKDVSATDLANAVRAAARGESLLQPVVARKLVEGFGELARQGGMVEALTEREIEVLRALASGARNKEIAFSLGLSESTIKTHLASIFGKLNVTTRTEAVAKGRDLGLISL